MVEKKYLRFLNKLVRQQGLEIIDVHVHPFDVVDASDFDHYHKLNELLYQHEEVKGEKYSLRVFRHTRFADHLKLSRFANEVMRFFDFREWLNFGRRGYSSSYTYIGIKRLVDEMKMAGIGKSVLLSLEPFNRLSDIYDYYKHSDRFYYMASADIHQMNKYEIQESLQWQIDHFPVVGIKMHPNLQGFYPFPDDNHEAVAEKLHAIYEFAGKHHLYVMLHSGLFEIPFNGYELDNYPLYKKLADDKYGMLSSYADEQGHSKLFEKYNNTFVIAHLFYSGPKYTDVEQIAALLNRYPQVYADTSNVPAYVLSEVIRTAGTDKLLFGSSALYNKQLVELMVVLKSIEDVVPAEEFDACCQAVLGQNFRNMLRQKRHVKENAYSQ